MSRQTAQPKRLVPLGGLPQAAGLSFLQNWEGALADKINTERESIALVDGEAPAAHRPAAAATLWHEATKHLDAAKVSEDMLAVMVAPRHEDPSIATVSQEIGFNVTGREDDDAQRIGAQLLNFAAELGLIDGRETWQARAAKMQFTSAALDCIAPQLRRYFDRHALRLPLTAPPSSVGKVNIKPSRKGKTIPPQPSSPDVAKALDVAQGTCWRVNQFVLDVVRQAYPDLMAAPLSGEGKAPAGLRKPPRGFPSLDLSQHAAIVQAEMMGARPFWYEFKSDWRGRIYAKDVEGLIYAGSNLVRALLEFNAGAVLDNPGSGDDGAAKSFLMLHLVECYGGKITKQSTSDKFTWCDANHDAILLAAQDPMRNLSFWRKAESPWLFLAACDAYRRAYEGFPVHLPIAVDVTTSAAQIIGCLLRDEDLAQRTGLLSDTIDDAPPPDVYAVLADDFGGRDMAKAIIIPKIYGAGAQKITGTIVAAKTAKKFPGQDRSVVREHAQSLYAKTLPKVRAAIVELDKRFPQIVALKDWLDSAGRAAAKRREVIGWSMPDGFQVTVDYRTVRKRRLSVQLRPGVRYRPELWSRTDKLDGRAMSTRAMMANFIHSWDAAYLREVLRQASDMGVSDFGLAHDSFAVGAQHMTALRKALIRARYIVFRPDRLAEVQDAWQWDCAPPGARCELPDAFLVGDGYR